MPTSQRPSRTWAGRDCAAPSRSARRPAQAFDELALRERPLGLFRIDLGVVEDAELDRIHAELLGHLVHGDLQRHQARRLARRAHGVAFGQVEHRQPHRGHPVGAGIEQRVWAVAVSGRRRADRPTSSRGRWR
jgi:hypothetical protein